MNKLSKPIQKTCFLEFVHPHQLLPYIMHDSLHQFLIYTMHDSTMFNRQNLIPTLALQSGHRFWTFISHNFADQKQISLNTGKQRNMALHNLITNYFWINKTCNKETINEKIVSKLVINGSFQPSWLRFCLKGAQFFSIFVPTINLYQWKELILKLSASYLFYFNF